MPGSGGRVVETVVDDAVEREYPHNGKTYVEMNLQAAGSYDETYEDDTPHGKEISCWPVTPFKVRAQNNSSETYWVELWLDGEMVDQLLSRPNQPITFEGFKRQGKMFAFLFALPRNQRITDGDEVRGGLLACLSHATFTRHPSACAAPLPQVVSTSRFDEIGTVKTKWLRAEYLRTEEKHVDGKDFDMRQANKIEANKIARKREKESGGTDSMCAEPTRRFRAVGGGSATDGRRPRACATRRASASSPARQLLTGNDECAHLPAGRAPRAAEISLATRPTAWQARLQVGRHLGQAGGRR